MTTARHCLFAIPDCRFSDAITAYSASFLSALRSTVHGRDIQIRRPPRQRTTGYSSNLRPVIGYSTEVDKNPQIAALCQPQVFYARTTALSYASPAPVEAKAEPTARLAMASGFVREIPATLPRSKEVPAPEASITQSEFVQKEYHPQPNEPVRGPENSEATWRYDMQKAMGSVHVKEQKTAAPYTRSYWDPRAMMSETTQRFIAPPNRPMTSLPNLVQPRIANPRSGVTGSSMFVNGTRTRPAYLTDPPSAAENKAIAPKGIVGAAMVRRLQRTDPCEYLNNVADPGATSRAIHTVQPTTRELGAADTARLWGVKNLDVGTKTESGALHNNVPSDGVVVIPAGSRHTNATSYSVGHGNAANHKFSAVSAGGLAAAPVRNNGFVRGTFVRPFGTMQEQHDVERLHPQVNVLKQQVLPIHPHYSAHARTSAVVRGG